MELAGQLAQAGHIIEAHQFRRPCEDALQFLDLARGRGFRSVRGPQRFQQEAQAVGVEHLLVRQFDHAHAAIRDAFGQSRGHQHIQRLADGSHAHAKGRGNVLLPEPFARFDLARNDAFIERLEGLISQRLALVSVVAGHVDIIYNF